VAEPDMKAHMVYNDLIGAYEEREAEVVKKG
jgi:hypothetical protein